MKIGWPFKLEGGQRICLHKGFRKRSQNFPLPAHWHAVFADEDDVENKTKRARASEFSGLSNSVEV